MGRNINEVIKNLPGDRQKKIAALSQRKVDEMIAHAATLTDFRKAVGRTQSEVAKELGINQNAVSQLEKRSDTYVSTLRRFLKSLGLTLELSVVDKHGTRIDLSAFDRANSVQGAEEVATKRSARQHTVKVAKVERSKQAASADTPRPARKKRLTTPPQSIEDQQD